MNKVLELSNKSSKGGRRKIKMILLTIHNKGEKNLNGISWNEQYIVNNLDSIKGIPICASFLDEEKDTPLDHGYTETVELEGGGLEPLFNNSECCGVIEDAKIEDLEINNETKRVLVGYGYLFYQRYKNFCDYIKTQIEFSEIKSSVEIVGKEGKNIVYDGGYNQEIRYPMEFDFSATAILGVKEADENCYVLEVAQNKKKEEEQNMTEQEIMQIVQKTITETNSVKSEMDVKVTELNTQIAEKDNVISELNASVAQLQTALDDLKKQHETYWGERDLLEQELVKAKVASKLGELDSTIGEFNEAEQELAKDDIEKVKASIEACAKKEDLENMTSEINSIKSKICMAIVEKQKKAEAESKTNEQNSAKETETIDIFAEVNSANADDKEDIDIFN